MTKVYCNRNHKYFFQEFSREDYDDIVGGWKDKLVRTAAGDQRWGVFYAEKPGNIETGRLGENGL